MSKPAEALAFLALALGLCLALFGDALWGRSMLAPVDLAAGQWPQYRFVDPRANGIPQNHHVVDQLSYDLPLQWTVYHAWRRGEVPWWDPFTYGGRPLLADAHASAADPVRVLCCLTLPRFELAYHWTRVLHFLIGGLGVFCLLRQLGIGGLIAGGAGLLSMVAGSNVLFFGHSWIQASFVYYPWLWLAWHRLWQGPHVGAGVAAPLLTACALYAGNLQSHTYLLVFALAFCLGYAGRSWAAWKRALAFIVPTGVFAGLLAAPVLGPEIELLAQNIRPLAGDTPQRAFDGLMVLSAAWPWSIGTFRTIMGSVLGFHPGFCAFIGSAGFILAVIGARSASGEAARRCGVALVLCFAAIMIVPGLTQWFYPRCAGLGVLGGIVLAAFGAETLRANQTAWRRATWVCAAFAGAVALGTIVVALILYPKLRPTLFAKMEAHAQTDGSEGRSQALRRFQVASYRREVGFANPEVLAAWLALAGLATLFAVPRWRRVGVPALLALNLVPPALFAHRFIPRVPIERWERLLVGGPLQQEARALLAPQGLRLEERPTSPYAAIFPQELAHLYGVHVAHGYAALVPSNMAWSDSVLADVRFSGGAFERVNPSGEARFSWIGEPRRSVKIVEETLNTITVEIGPGPGGWLLRTDTRYPGWTAAIPRGWPHVIQPEGPLFTRISIPSNPTRIQLTYRPTGHVLALVLAVVGILGVIAWMIALKHKRRLRSERPSI